jgi:hypothetical protein
MEDPKQDHMVAMKNLLRYAVGTINYGLTYTRGDVDLNGYSDQGYIYRTDGCYHQPAVAVNRGDINGS